MIRHRDRKRVWIAISEGAGRLAFGMVSWTLAFE
jgi:hypothetical protein